MTSTPTRTVDNVVITTKGLQDRNINILDETMVENKGKLILTKIYLFRVANELNLNTIFSVNFVLKKVSILI